MEIEETKKPAIATISVLALLALLIMFILRRRA